MCLYDGGDMGFGNSLLQNKEGERLEENLGGGADFRSYRGVRNPRRKKRGEGPKWQRGDP